MSDRLPERLWRCDCGGEVLGVSFYYWKDDPPDWFIEVYKMPARHSWGWRIRQAANLLLGREVVIDSVSLNHFKVAELMEWFAESIAEADAAAARASGTSA